MLSNIAQKSLFYSIYKPNIYAFMNNTWKVLNTSTFVDNSTFVYGLSTSSLMSLNNIKHHTFSSLFEGVISGYIYNYFGMAIYDFLPDQMKGVIPILITSSIILRLHHQMFKKEINKKEINKKEIKKKILIPFDVKLSVKDDILGNIDINMNQIYKVSFNDKTNVKFDDKYFKIHNKCIKQLNKRNYYIICEKAAIIIQKYVRGFLTRKHNIIELK